MSDTTRLPKHRHFKPKNLAVVRLDGHDFYLGKYNSPESREKYGRLVGRWLADGATPEIGRVAESESPALTVTQVVLAFWKHAEQHYRHADGTPTGELRNFRDSLKPLRELYGSAPAAEFSPKCLKTVRASMIAAELARGTINQRVGRIVHVFKWAASEEIVPAAIHAALKTVAGLQKGRTEARETDPIGPVADALVEAVRPHVSRQVWTMIELQRITGMRPGEVVIMRTGDLDVSGRVWTYVPGRHKTEHRGKGRTIYIGPRAQDILRPWLRTDLAAYLFSPGEARDERHATMRAARKSRVQPSQRNRKNARAKRRPGARYSARTYFHAIRRACHRAFPHPILSVNPPKDLSSHERAELDAWQNEHRWHPNQLRHSAATRLRKEFGLDVARVILGHTSPAVTEVYAEVDREKAVRVMGEVG